VTEADAALLVADHHEGSERKVLTALHDLRNAVDRDQLVDDLRLLTVFIAVTTATATITAATTTFATFAFTRH